MTFKFAREFLSKDFVRNTLTLLTGTSLAQALSVILVPLLARVYTPSDFGTLSIFTAITSVLCVIINGRYELAVMLPEQEKDALSVLFASLCVVVALSLFGFITIYLFKSDIANLVSEDLFEWIYFIPLSLLFVGVFQAFNFWCNRNKDFRTLAKSRISQTAFGPGSQLALGSAQVGGGLIWGNLLGQIITAAYLLVKSWEKIKKYSADISVKSIVDSLKKYKRFPIVSTWGALLDSGAVQLPIFMLEKFFSSATVGFFSLSLRALSLPIALITSSLAQVLFQKIVEIHHRDPASLRRFVLKTFAILSSVAVPFVILVYFFGEEVFVIVLGEQWREAGQYAPYIAFAVSIRAIVSPLSSVLTLEHNIKLGTFWQILYFFTLGLTLYFCRNLEIIELLKIYMLHELVLYSLYFSLILIASRERSIPAKVFYT